MKYKLNFIKKKNKSENVEKKLNLAFRSKDFRYAEAYKSLRTNLKFVSINNECKKIAITSSIPGEGKSNVAINLAVSLSEEGHKVLLVDCDLRKPVIHKYLKFRLRNKGLTSILSGQTSIKEVTIVFEDIDINVIGAGPIPPNPAEMLASKRMQEFILEVDKMYDYIIFDTPPLSAVTDAAVLSQYIDGILMVIRQKHVTIDVAQKAISSLKRVNANIIGAVFNDYDMKLAGTSGNYYYYEYEN